MNISNSVIPPIPEGQGEDIILHVFSRILFSNSFLGAQLRQQQEVAKFIQNKKGHLLLYLAGYVYARNGNNRNQTKIYWQCRNKNKTEKCQARAVTHENYIIDWKGVHIHSTNITKSDELLENNTYFSKTILKLSRNFFNC